MVVNKELTIVGKNIKLYRDKKGFTQQELANRLDVDVSEIVSLENGTNEVVNLSKIFEIAGHLNVRIVQLVE